MATDSFDDDGVKVQDWQKGKYGEPWRTCSYGCRCMSIMEFAEHETGADDWYPRLSVKPTHDGIATARIEEYRKTDFDLPPRIAACVNACANIPDGVLLSDAFLDAVAGFRVCRPRGLGDA